MRLNDLLAVLLLLTPSIIGLACVPAFIILLKRHGVKWAAAVMVFLAVESVLAALWTVSTSPMGFGPGMFTLYLAPLMTALALALWLILVPSSFRAFGPDKARRRFYLIGGLLVVALQLSPVVGYFALWGECDAQNRRIAGQIIAAAETYRQDHGNYPQREEDLVPVYLATWPWPTCSWTRTATGKPVPYMSGFAFIGTPSGAFGFGLTVPSTSFGQVQIYDHATRQWQYQKVLD
jgi:hypothetical protein